ncbi:heme lyase CcmF/NrfE family subunit [Alkalimarinus sediminis]|uniref:Heme lyase CcmF/NrfE family subunit n=1 Tax=Alkalimarinus sediminis TaxID=1632866 RepID=A0A9E8HM92_9ALTE|nr:heme lyase CcmF/NrfE family subunit [Alkalimarinus sediminis]UZW76712.1 heme lyase CcmF/NrfE family subunit [Alkalimarinus sediminis]
MLPELGHFALILAFAIAIIQAIVPLVGTIIRSDLWMSFARPMATGQFVFLMISFVCLSIAFVTDDFSVQYVASHSNSHLPYYFKISAVWGGHEGSLLLWALILAGWSFAVAVFSRDLPQDMVARVLSIMGMVSVGFGLFILATSNPFTRYLPEFPQEGADLNPLLQDIGLILHPPMLYMGYVGFSVAFAFALAALMSGRLDAAWARWSRPWTTVAWAFLTLGISLGSWWAYYELGWGGWWFWDPVENASFMPWLVGTALMHSLAVTEKRGVFKSWTVLLAIIAFSLSLLGTFLVRSGVLTSVHAFASDPARGAFILGLLAITLVGALTLYALRAPAVSSRATHTLLSRESFLLLNNVFLMVATVTVFLGTLYPLFMDFIGGGKLSVGAPYFNKLFVPIVSVLVAIMGVGIVSRWKDTKVEYLVKQLWLAAILSTGLALLFPFMFGGEFNASVFLGMWIAFWLTAVTFKDIWNKSSSKQGRIKGLSKLGRSYTGMVLGHLGLAAAIIGICLVSNYEEERDLRLAPGDSVVVAGFEFKFDKLTHKTGPNYEADQAIITVWADGEQVTTLKPEKRVYNAQRSMMTEAAIDPGLFRDLYVAMGEPLDGDAWAIRVHYKPFVRWMWLGSLMMAAGGFLAITDRRYRIRKKKSAPQETNNIATKADSASPRESQPGTV